MARVAGTSSTAERFFAIVELLSYTFSLLRPHDLLAASRVNKQFHSVIRGSALLRSNLSRGPTRHYSEKSEDEWALENIRLNYSSFRWGFEFSVAKLEDSQLHPAISVAVWPGSKPLRCQLFWQTQCHNVWDNSADDMVPFDRMAHDLGPQAEQYLMDPPLPTTITCQAVRISPEKIITRRIGKTVYYFDNANVSATVSPCTFGEIVEVAKALERSPPKNWTQDSDSHSRQWHPREWCPEEYPELMAEPAFRAAVATVKERPVLFEALPSSYEEE